MKKCSIIIRTKNEERWINSCLKSIFSQTYKKFEIIIVDNESNDATIEKAKKYDVKEIIKIKNYLPGKALNKGIKHASGEYIVCISAHCIPVNKFWLENLVRAVEQKDKVAGAYGRQEPMSFSSASDKRDLLLVFGLDSRIQIKDSFFHNANSIIKKDILDKYPFSSTITNIEDRLWAKDMIDQGYELAYSADASVYHYHGIHQGGSEERLNNIVKIIEGIPSLMQGGKINPNELNICAIIPHKGDSQKIGDRHQIGFSINSAKHSKYINSIIVSTDNKVVSDNAISLGAESPFLRPKNLSEKWVSIEMVQKFTINKLEAMGRHFDLIVHLEETFPFRDNDLIDKMIDFTILNGFDTVIACKKESGFIWHENKVGKFSQIDEGDVPREIKKKTYVGFKGLACVTHPEFVRNGSLLGEKVGLFSINNLLPFFEIRDQNSRNIAEQIIKNKISY